MAVRTTLGPKGMDKMLVNTLGDVIITGDGATILKEMEIEHPAAKMIIEVSKAQELFDLGIHPTVIEKGFRLASDRSKEILDSLAFDVSARDDDVLLKIANTAIKRIDIETPEQMGLFLDQEENFLEGLVPKNQFKRGKCCILPAGYR